MEEILAYGHDRKSWLVFCAGVDHAFHVRDALRAKGIACATMHDAGQQFSQYFARAFASGFASPKLDGLPGGTAPGQMMVERNAGAARAVRDALDAMGGNSSPAGSALWFVAGLQLSVRDWALPEGWNGKRVEKNEAKGILVAALGVLARYYGYEHALRPRRETSTHA